MANTWPEYTANDQTISKQLKIRPENMESGSKSKTNDKIVIKCDGEFHKSAKMPEPAAAAQG